MESSKPVSPGRGHLADLPLGLDLLPRKDYLKEYREKYGKKSALGENREISAGTDGGSSASISPVKTKTCDLIAKYLKKDYPSLFRKDALEKLKMPDDSVNTSSNSRTAAILTNPEIVKYLGRSALLETELPHSGENGDSRGSLQKSRKKFSGSVNDISKLDTCNGVQDVDKAYVTSDLHSGKSLDTYAKIPSFDEFKSLKSADKIGIFTRRAEPGNTGFSGGGLKRASSERSLLFEEVTREPGVGHHDLQRPHTSFDTHVESSNPTRPKIMTRCHSDVTHNKNGGKVVVRDRRKRNSIDIGECNQSEASEVEQSPRQDNASLSRFDSIVELGKTYTIDENPRRKKDKLGHSKTTSDCSNSEQASSHTTHSKVSRNSDRKDALPAVEKTRKTGGHRIEHHRAQSGPSSRGYEEIDVSKKSRSPRRSNSEHSGQNRDQTVVQKESRSSQRLNNDRSGQNKDQLNVSKESRSPRRSNSERSAHNLDQIEVSKESKSPRRSKSQLSGPYSEHASSKSGAKSIYSRHSYKDESDISNDDRVRDKHSSSHNSATKLTDGQRKHNHRSSSRIKAADNSKKRSTDEEDGRCLVSPVKTRQDKAGLSHIHDQITMEHTNANQNGHTNTHCETATGAKGDHCKKTDRKKKHKTRSSMQDEDNSLPVKGNTVDENIFQQKKMRISLNSTREDILSYLDDIKRSGFAPADDSSSVQSSEECFEEDSLTQNRPKSRIHRHKLSNFSFASTNSSLCSNEKQQAKQGEDSLTKGTEIERVDSGVGSETRAVPTIRLNEVDLQGIVCEDCDKVIETDAESVEDHLLNFYVCQKCQAKRIERSEAIREIVETEISYGRDLQIIKEEFYLPIQTAGLLTADQVNTVFINLEELITINNQFVNTLQDTLDIAMETGDEDLTSVSVGSLFLEYSNMFLAFENYCVNHTCVPPLLESLQKEKDLLRIFLYVSQTENSLLRRMNLKSFLMVPIQRIMKYPLLLSRLNKTTPVQHKDKEAVKQAQHKIEHILEHINNKTGGSAGLRQKQRLSKKSKAVENLELVKVALEALNWSRQDAHIIVCGKLNYAQPSDATWMKKVKQLKWTPLHALLITLGKPDYYEVNKETFVFPKSTHVRQAALVLIKEKGGKFTPLKEPVFLEKSLVFMDTDYKEAFELAAVGDDLIVLKCDESMETMAWFNHLKQITLSLGHWRKRRPALANIMIQSKNK